MDYGLIGNGQSAALISPTGSINWLCLPAFDSPSVFGHLLDHGNGGSFRLNFVGEYQTHQSYLKNTNVLITRFDSAHATVEVVDFMPRWELWEGRQQYTPAELVRTIRVKRGEPELRVEFDPRLNYALSDTSITLFDPSTLLATDGEQSLFLTTNLDAQSILAGHSIRLCEREDYFIQLTYGQPPSHAPSCGTVQEGLDKTVHYWRRWVKNCYLPDEYQADIIRSALTLKMLIYERTGAVIAAPTTSLPEIEGGNRNWDYRFCWLRDSYFIVDSLLKLSKFEETENYIAYLKNVIKDNLTTLRPLYTIEGDLVPPVTELSHWSGVMGSRPVRIGNDATDHHQTDAYGEVILALYPLFFDDRVVRFDGDHLWGLVERLVTMAITQFPVKDNGIWEIGNPPRHYTFSKLFCWVAVDRGCDIAYRQGKQTLYRRWNKIRRDMKQEILKEAWNPEVGAFTQYYGGESLDASTLLMPIVGLIDPKDPRMVSTVKRSEEQLTVNGLMFRYTHPDELGNPENAFAICTFWLIDALILMGQKKRARQYFHRLLKMGNSLGLFSEHINPTTGEMIGNFPQGYTHVAVINTAMLLAR